MKRMTSLMLVLCLALLPCGLSAGAEGTTAAKTDAIVQKFVPVYLERTGKLPDGIPVYYLDGVDDLPYMDLNEIAGVINGIYRETMTDPTDLYLGEYDDETQMYILCYEPAGAAVVFSLGDQTIQLVDYELFTSSNGRLMDLLFSTGFNEQTGLPELFERVTRGQIARKGSIRLIELERYGLEIIEREGMRLLPMHLLMTLLVGVPNLLSVSFNGEDLFLGGKNMLSRKVWDPESGKSVEQLTELGEIYYSAPQRPRSKAFAEEGLAEFCLIMDTFYGLKEVHNIASFYDLIVNLEMLSDFLSPEAAQADQALADLLNYYLDDLHSAYNHNSYLTGVDTEIRNDDGYSSASYNAIGNLMNEAESIAMPDGPYAYQEIGDTAYVYFDEFVMKDLDYYALDLDDQASIGDTISLIMFAHHQITREGSPVKNVVLDLSKNGGGDVDAGVFVIGWFLGEAQLSMVSTISGAQAVNLYHVDVNADHLFDDRDSLYQNYNLYCLISPLSFSCGNLVPWTFHASGLVTLIGDTSGGGSCLVLPLSTAWGTIYQTSGPYRLAFIKNGSYYDIDRGVDPDVHLNRRVTFFDREALTEIIHDLR